MYRFIYLIILLSIVLNADTSFNITRQICSETLEEYPRICLQSKSLKSWLRVFSNPDKARLYHLYIDSDKGFRDYQILIKCLKEFGSDNKFKSK